MTHTKTTTNKVSTGAKTRLLVQHRFWGGGKPLNSFCFLLRLDLRAARVNCATWLGRGGVGRRKRRFDPRRPRGFGFASRFLFFLRTQGDAGGRREGVFCGGAGARERFAVIFSD